MYAFRWVEIWEPSTNFRVSVEVFLNSQVILFMLIEYTKGMCFIVHCLSHAYPGIIFTFV